MEWHVIPTGRVLVEAGGPFGLVPQPMWENRYTPDEHHRTPMDLNCLLVYSEGKTIVVDTGLGDKLSPKARENWGYHHPEGTLLDNLAQHGVKPQDVDIVIDTHLHSDHCGGNTCLMDGEAKPTFPRAEYLVQWIEWADATHPDARTRNTYLLENYVPVWKAGQFRFQRGDEQVTSEVRCAVTRGHTRGHQCVILETGEAPVLFVADLASYAIHMERTGWVTAYDVEPLENITTKKKWQRWALENEAQLVFEHDVGTRMGVLREEEGRLRVEKIESRQ